MEMMKNSIGNATFQAAKALHLYRKWVGKIKPIKINWTPKKKPDNLIVYRAIEPSLSMPNRQTRKIQVCLYRCFA